MLELAQQVQHEGVVAPALDAQRSLPYGREAYLGRQVRADAILPADPVQTGGGKQNRIEVLFFELAQPRIDVARGPTRSGGPGGGAAAGWRGAASWCRRARLAAARPASGSRA